MTLIIYIAIAFVFGFGIAWIIHIRRSKGLEAGRSVAEARLSDAEAALQRERRERSEMQLAFKGISAEVLKETREEFLKQAEPCIGGHIRPLADSLRRYEEALRAVESERKDAYGGLKSLVGSLQEGHSRLAKETTTLTQALKNPVTRGKHGEMTLRRVVELAGMSAHCDFTEQATVEGAEGRQRPDMTVHLPGGQTIVVDSKAPNKAYVDAMEATDESMRKAHLAAHAQAVRDHMRSLGQKAYWTQFEPAPDFVVLFLPGESFFSAALEQDRELIEDGMKSHVVLASPITLIVLLRSAAMGWQQQQLADNALRISEAGKDLFDRCVSFSKHLGSVGAGLGKAVNSYNDAIGSWERRVIPGARNLKELGATRVPDQEVPEIEPIEVLPRRLPGSKSK